MTKRTKIAVPFLPHEVGFAVDSGAFTMTARMAKKVLEPDELGFFEDGSSDFWDYLQHYCQFVDTYRDRLDFYVVLDAIGAAWDPMDTASKTYRTQRLMEDWGLDPMPVYHVGEDEDWLRYYVDNYEYIGIGGFGVAGKSKHYFRVVRDLFSRFILDSSGRPRCKVHGFAITSLGLQLAVPWYSVDSASWTFTGANGAVLVPKYDFVGGKPKTPRWFDIPLTLYVKEGSRYLKERDKHHGSMSSTAKKAVNVYLDLLDVDMEPMQRSPDYRNAVNLVYFLLRQKLVQDHYRDKYGIEEGGYLYFAGHPASTTALGVRALMHNLKGRLANLEGVGVPRFLGTFIDNPYLPYVMAACGMKLRMKENVKDKARKGYK